MRLKRLEEAIVMEAAEGANASVIQALQGLRGIGLVNAVTIAAEIGSFERFKSPMQLMGFSWSCSSRILLG
ncbi:transposase [Paenibacillus dendritiformis]|uniref:transposase n=1 Tax=Paenibacillus dendritiformis TaxID=130049 RepID=UPI003B970753